jgi:hypothetical protein
VSGLVDWQGNNPATRPVGVTAGTSTTASMELDSAAQINAVFDTQVGAATAVAAKSQWLTLANAKLTVGAKTFTASPATAPNATISAQNLFPFTDGYGGYAGKCSTNSPALPPNTSTLPVYTPTAGSVLTMTTANDIRMPSINVQVVGSTSSNTATNGATIIVKTADGCTNTFPNQVSAAKTYGSTTYQGALPEPGFPYGSYKLCAQNSTATAHGHADVFSGSPASYDAKQNNAVSAETAANRVDDTVTNYAPGGNSPTVRTAGAIRLKLNRTGPCE